MVRYRLYASAIAVSGYPKLGHWHPKPHSRRLPQLPIASRLCRVDGYNESFNGKLRNELLNGEIFYTLKEAKVLVEQWRIHYNTVRPHSSPGYRPPAPQAINPLVMSALAAQQ